MKIVDVAVGVVVKANRTFVCLRPNDKHQGGKWEFPGGKIETNETAHHALVRELTEEIAITVTHAQPLVTVSHDYGDKQVRLVVFVVDGFSGEPMGNEGQSGKWLEIDALEAKDFPAANKPIIDELRHWQRKNCTLKLAN